MKEGGGVGARGSRDVCPCPCPCPCPHRALTATTTSARHVELRLQSYVVFCCPHAAQSIMDKVGRLMAIQCRSSLSLWTGLAFRTARAVRYVPSPPSTFIIYYYCYLLFYNYFYRNLEYENGTTFCCCFQLRLPTAKQTLVFLLSSSFISLSTHISFSPVLDPDLTPTRSPTIRLQVHFGKNQLYITIPLL